MADVVNTVTIRMDVDNEGLKREMAIAEATVAKLAQKMDVGAQKGAVAYDKRLSPAVRRAAFATTDLKVQQEILEDQLANGKITTEGFSRGMQVATQATNNATKATKGYALAATRGMRGPRAFGNAVQQAGFQVGDFAVQIASGQSALRAFIQQGTQLVSMFGPTGAVIGAVGAIAGAVIMAFQATDEGAKKASASVDAYKSSLAALKSVEEELLIVQRKLNDEMTDARVITGVQAIAAAEKELAAAMKERAKLEPKESTDPSARMHAQMADEQTMKKRQAAARRVVAAEMKLYEIKRALIEVQKKEVDLIVKKADLLERQGGVDGTGDLSDATNAATARATKQAEAERKAKAVADKKAAKEAAAAAKKEDDILLRERVKRETEIFKANQAYEAARIKKQLADRKKAADDALAIEEQLQADVMEADRKGRSERIKAIQKGVREREKVAEKAKRAAEKAADELAKINKKAADESAQAWEKQFSKMGDALGDFVKTGKLDFNSLAESIIDDLIRISIQQQIVQPLAGIMGGIGSSIMGSIFGGAQTNAEGGSISGPGSGTSDSILSFLSNGEFVVNAKSAKQHRALLEAINSGNIPQRFNAGGAVSAATSAAAANNNGIGTSVQIIDQRGSNAPPVSTQRGRGPDGREILRAIILPEVAQGIASGQFDGALGSSFGLSRAGSSR